MIGGPLLTRPPRSTKWRKGGPSVSLLLNIFFLLLDTSMVAANEKKKGFFLQNDFNVSCSKSQRGIIRKPRQIRKTIAKNAFQNLVLKTRIYRHWDWPKAERETITRPRLPHISWYKISAYMLQSRPIKTWWHASIRQTKTKIAYVSG